MVPAYLTTTMRETIPMPTNILSINDPDCGFTQVDLSDRDLLVITQMEEEGAFLTVYLTPAMLAQMLPEIKAWLHLTIPQY